MNARTIFLTDGGALRAPWRIGVFLLALYPAATIGAYIVAPVVGSLYRLAGVPAGNAFSFWIELTAALLATWLVLRKIDRRSWVDIGLGRDAARTSLMASGFAMGALAVGIPILFLLAVHWLAFGPSYGGSWPLAAVRVSLLLAPAALAEELLFRGYVFSVLREVWGWRIALVVMSLLFGLIHLINPGATVRSLTLVVLAGFFLGGVLVATGSLYAAWAAHFAWNWTMAVVFHTAVSGMPIEAPGYQVVDRGPDWVTGGAWGPEGGAAAGVGMMGGMAYLIARRRRREES